MTLERHDGDDLFVRLGHEPGPARPLSRESSEAIARATVRHVRDKRARRRALWVRLQAAAGALVALMLGGAALAAVTSYLEPPSAEEVAGQDEARQPGPRVERHQPVAPAPTVAEHEDVEPEATARDTTPRPKPGPGALLERANRLRRRGQWARAERLYTRIVRTAGDPHAVYVAMVAAASLRLEHRGHPRRALKLYQNAMRLRPAGPLAATIRYGMAECHRALERPGAEAAALEAFIDTHPKHLRRPQAEARLDELRAAND